MRLMVIDGGGVPATLDLQAIWRPWWGAACDLLDRLPVFESDRADGPAEPLRDRVRLGAARRVRFPSASSGTVEVSGLVVGTEGGACSSSG
jgi:hypothetical protein